MTDSEIVKAFECCNNGWCDNRCPYYGREDIADCREQNGADLLDFINRKQAEIERFTDLNKVLERDVFNAEMNLEHVQRHIDEFRKCDADVKFRKRKIQEEAVKEFAERLISKAKSKKERFLLESLVESVVKEMGCRDESKT